MKNLTFVLFLTLFINTPPAMAGSGHDHGHSHSHEQKPVSSEVAMSQASRNVNDLAASGKIDASWAGIKASKAEKKTFKDKQEWVVTFNNKKVNDTKKQTLYLFLSLGGEYIAANYTGK